jgi:WD40 repeat protein
VVKTEAVSSRFLRSLVHPERKANFSQVVFTPDGRLVVAGYPSGVVQVFDPASGQELRKIETPRGYRGTLGYLRLSADRRTVFVALDDSKFEPLREGENKSWYRRYRGELRLYDLETGDQKARLRVDPPRGVMTVAVAPDGRTIATMEYSSGRSEDFDNLRAIYLWDVPSGKVRKLRDGYGDPRFSPDGKTVFVTVNDHARKTGVVYAHSVETGKEVGRLESKAGVWPQFVFSGDGKWAAGSTLDPGTKKPLVRLYHPTKLEVSRTFTAPWPEGTTFISPLAFSPDGKSLLGVAQKTVYLWDTESGKLLRSWALQTPGRVLRLAFSPTGRQVALFTWYTPPELANARDEAITPEDFPQPKVFLLDVTADEAETIVCPHGWLGQLTFSPDGKVLVVSGTGAVHLFDAGKKER